jgi:RNA polymerase sigma-70 factor
MSMDSKNLFEILMRENASMLTVYLRSVVRDAAVVDDLFQETMLTAWKNIGRFDKSKPFGPWLRGIAAKLILAHRRKSAKSLFLCDAPMLEHLESRFQVLEQQQGDTFSDKLAYLRECMAELPHMFREVILQRYTKLLSRQEIALNLDVSDEAVKKRLQRARSQLLECVLRKMAREEASHGTF